MQPISNSKELSVSNPITSVSFAEAFWYWLRLGFLSFGGPSGQIALMHHDLVENKRWISEGRFLHALNYCMLLPGPEAQQLAIYIGWLLHRGVGGIVAGVLFVLPSFFILSFLAWIYMAYGTLPVVLAVLYGVKPAVVAIVLFASYRIGLRTLNNQLMWVIAISAFIAIFVFNLPFPLILLAAASLGYLLSQRAPQYFKRSAAHAASNKGYGPALIDDDTATPEHAYFSWKKMLKVGVIGVALWLLAMLLLWLNYGWRDTYTQMAWFFSKAALVTFGGAYAVLPYVYQGAVEHFHWLTTTQMMDGLALGETTPGPLIMVVTFVGFVGGWGAQTAGVDAISSALLAAAIVTFFTFLPSFIFILMGAPLIESTHGQLKFTAPLAAISAAVVGVIFNLALFFVYHVLWPHGWTSPVELPSVLILFCACLALFRFKVNVVLVIAGCGLLGLVYRTII
jgi:chromate transporter